MSLTKKEVAEVREYLERRKKSCQTGKNVGRICDNGIKIVDKHDKYAWHDLRENPDDLPSDDRNVNVCLRVGENKRSYHTAYLDDEGVWTLPMDGSPNETFDNVIAWREIEPFEGGE